MNRFRWVILIVTGILLAVWIYRPKKASGISEVSLKAIEENQKELQTAVGEVFELIQGLEDRVGSLESSIPDLVEVGAGSVVENSNKHVASESKVLTDTEEEYTVLGDGTLVFNKSSRIELMGGFSVSSPTGLMRSNSDKTMIYGDIVVERPNGKRDAVGAVMVEPDGKWTMTLKDHPLLRDLDYESLREE